MGEKLQVGQKLWLVPGDSRYSKYAAWVTVKKVGRRWADIDMRKRVDMETLRVDNGGVGYADRCFLSKEAYEAECELASAWRHVDKLVSGFGQRPRTTVDRINQALELLGYPPYVRKPGG